MIDYGSALPLLPASCWAMHAYGQFTKILANISWATGNRDGYTYTGLFEPRIGPWPYRPKFAPGSSLVHTRTLSAALPHHSELASI